MNLGFYYHLPIDPSNGELKTHSEQGVFLDELASHVDRLTLFLHRANEKEIPRCEYKLTSKNIRFIDMGFKLPAWDRFLFPKKTLSKIIKEVSSCDLIMVRAPSPLAPQFYSKLHKYTKTCYLVVGDYVHGAKHLHQPWWRKIPIIILSARNDRQLTKSLQNSLTLVNSPVLYDKYRQKVKNLYQVRTTTISKADLYHRELTCDKDEIKLLYTGRLDLAKGLRELLKATAILVEKNINASLHLVAWEDDPKKPIELLLRNLALRIKIQKRVFFYSRKKLGSELNEMYRMADIYLIPSYHEGFPRTIWEAMANSLPVIASKVGGIPEYVGNAAVLIEPQNISDISDAVSRLVQDSKEVKRLIKRGYKLASQNTLENTVSEMFSIINNNFKVVDE